MKLTDEQNKIFFDFLNYKIKNYTKVDYINSIDWKDISNFIFLLEKIELLEEEIKKAKNEIFLVKEMFPVEVKSLIETLGLSKDVPIR